MIVSFDSLNKMLLTDSFETLFKVFKISLPKFIEKIGIGIDFVFKTNSQAYVPTITVTSLNQNLFFNSLNLFSNKKVVF